MALLLAGCQSGQKEQQSKRVGGPLVVEYIVAAPRPVDHRLGFAGTLLANERVEVRAEITGRIVSIGFDEGAFVKQGDLLVKIDDADLQAQLTQNRLQRVTAESEMNRRRDLLDVKGISQEEYETARLKFESLKAAHELLLAHIAKTEIRAPFNGLAGLRYVSSGAVVSPANLISTLQQTDPIKIEIDVPEIYAADLEPGRMVSFTTPTAHDEWKATLYAIDPAIDAATRTIKVRARCANPENQLIPGGFARVQLPVAAGCEGIMIPARAIVPVLNGQQVYVMAAGKAVPRDVAIGRRSDSEVEILNGLQAGDTVVMSGLLQIKPGMALKAKPNTP